MTNWKEYKLGEIAKVKGGKRLPKGSRLTTIPNTHPYIRVRDMGSKYMPTSNLEYVPDDVFPSIKNYIVDKKDVILSIVGSVGLVSIVNDKLDKANLTENCVKILPDTKTLNKEFLYYFLSSSIGQNEIYKKIVGAVQPKLPIYNINDISINLPPLPTQTAIAEILSSLDDKIELNNKINQELENLVQTLFKQWFIDFEFHCLPENYKFSGAVKPTDFDAIMTYKRVGGLPLPDGQSWFVYVLLCDDDSFYKGMTNDLYRRFYEHFTGIGADHTKMHQPVKVIHWEQFDSKEEAAIREKELKTGYERTWLQRQWAKVNGGSPAPESQLRMAGEMIDSELGEVPKGWEVKTLGELIKLTGGGTPKRSNLEYWDGNIKWFSIQDVPQSSQVFVIDTKETISQMGLAKSSTKLLDKGSTIITARGTVGKLALVAEPMAMNQSCYAVNGACDLGDFFTYFNLKNAVEQLRQNTHGAVFDTITSNTFDTIKSVFSSLALANLFEELISPTMHLIESNCRENQELTNLRDTLLPKLISGELEVNNHNF